MFGFLFAEQNTPFAVAIVVMLVIAAIEAVGLLIGGSASDLIEGMAGGGADIGGPHGDGLTSHVPESTLSSLLSWLRVGQVPILVLLIVFLAAFGLVGYVVQSITLGATNTLLPSYLAAIPAFAAAVPSVRIFGGGLARVMPKDETEAVTSASLVGHTATITLGTARSGKPAQAKLKDAHGQTHYVMVEPDDPAQSFEQGDTVLLVRQDRSRFFAIVSDNVHLQGNG